MSLRRMMWVAAFLVPVPARAQSDTAAVLTTVRRLFAGMRASDSAMIRSTFAPIIRFAEVNRRATPARIESDSVGGWLAAVARSNHRWDERIHDVEVRLDADLAQVWAPYTFYLDGAISHCGVDALQLVQDADGWKITQLSDTRRRERCPDVPK
ncbi:MAG TPA: hypothetical protein VJ867_03215 [Gemmatimonadaceae bacterium]|nr:hypothetical protein [Gemmatimonadaceae bacterium]